MNMDFYNFTYLQYIRDHIKLTMFDELFFVECGIHANYFR